ncbi:hypothetical protein CH354_18260 [Leptospira levettii]|nr:hypothetical protein CH354_18260 [Leptospira levettii]PJZ86928.1 hypothetical protein CH368_19445 [Leptospira levettii]PJZ98820.1 hypothetical protein CH369_18205 [Leptospira levettii]
MQCPKSYFEYSVQIFADSVISGSLSCFEKAVLDFVCFFEEILLMFLFSFRLSHYSFALFTLITVLFYIALFGIFQRKLIKEKESTLFTSYQHFWP